MLALPSTSPEGPLRPSNGSDSRRAICRYATPYELKVKSATMTLMQNVRKAHFIGIGGVGMSAVAKLLKDAGVEVTGSDEAVYLPVSEFLAKEGFTVRTPYAAANIPADADLIVIGKNAKLIPETNPEVAAALASGVRVASFPEVLAELVRGKKVLLVAGSYGKSTCAAPLAHCLGRAGLEPSYFIGASPITPESPAKFGSGEYFVIEGDEYPSSNTDPRSKFLHFKPLHALITPLAHDHFNVFPTPESYLKPFADLVPLVSKGLVVATSGALSGEFLKHLARPVVMYGEGGEYTATDIRWGERTRFTLIRKGQTLCELETSLLGEHNIENIVGVAALAFSQKLLSAEELARGVASFKGVRRRMDRRSEGTSIPIYEGFGSSKEKLQNAIAAMKRHFPERRLVVVFEPHTFSWRQSKALPWYDDAFAGAAEVVVYCPPEDGKTTELTTEEIVKRISASGVEAYGFTDTQALLKEFGAALAKNEAVLLSSSGAMGGLIEEIPKLAEEKFPA